MQDELGSFVRRVIPGTEAVAIENLAPIPGGFSRETFRFDAHVRRDGVSEVMAMILRKDPPAASALLQTSRQVEHDLIEAVRANTNVPISQSYGVEMDASVFGEPAMLIQRMPGSGHTSNLFNEGADVGQADDVMRHLCEVMAELHTTDVSLLNAGGALSDPRGVGIDTTSWDSYMNSTFEYYINAYPASAFDPAAMILLDAALTLRRNKPRPLQLALVHGDFNPANFLYDNGRVTAMIDWENSRVGDPREDLGWMMAMDAMSNTSVMAHPRDQGGFLAYYNELTGFDITPDELGYFTLFGTSNIAMPVTASIRRRVNREHYQVLHLYILQPASTSFIGFTQLLGYPGATA